MATNEDLAQTVEEEVRRMHSERILNAANTIADELLIHASNDVPKLPENIFVAHYLPLFSGEQSLVGNSDLIDTWLGIAGSRTGEVAIIDQKGQELFRVPPIMDTSHINVVDRDEGKSFADITAMSMLYSQNIVSQGEQYLNQNVNEKIGTLVGPPKDQNKERWDAIMRRYNKLPASTKTTTVDQTEQDDLIEYDDN